MTKDDKRKNGLESDEGGRIVYRCLFILVVGLFISTLAYIVFNHKDMSATAGNVTYTGNNITFTVLEYFESESRGYLGPFKYYKNGTYYDCKIIANLANNEVSKRYKNMRQKHYRQSNVYIKIYQFEGPESLQDLVKPFEVNGYYIISSVYYPYFSITGERNLTVNGMPATEISYLALQEASSGRGEKGIIIFIEKKPGSIYYAIHYKAYSPSDFKLDKVNYDRVVSTFQAQ